MSGKKADFLNYELLLKCCIQTSKFPSIIIKDSLNHCQHSGLCTIYMVLLADIISMGRGDPATIGTTNEIDDHGRFQGELDPRGRKWSLSKVKFRVNHVKIEQQWSVSMKTIVVFRENLTHMVVVAIGRWTPSYPE